MARLDADGTADSSFVADANQSVSHLALQDDGRILVAGSFTQLNGVARARFARLQADGSLDEAFDPAPNQALTTFVIQPDGRILVSGLFTRIGGQPVERLARLEPDGSLDPSFSASVNRGISSFGLQADGRVLVVGGFRLLNGVPWTSIGRLNPDGSSDLTFHPEVTWNLSASIILMDGSVLVGGETGGVPEASLPPSGFGRLHNTEPATQSLEYHGSTITWLRHGTSPEVARVTFEHSLDGTAWTMLEAPSRIHGGWVLAEVSLPAAGTLRARGYLTSGQFNRSSGFVETRLTLSQPAPPQIVLSDLSPRFTDGGFAFDVIGASGAKILVEVSLDLSVWTSLETLTLGDEGATVIDPTADRTGDRFYRVRPMP